MGILDRFLSILNSKDQTLSSSGPVGMYAGKDLSETVTSKKLHAPTKEEITRSKAEEDAITGPTIGPISIDPTDYITPGGLAKIGAVLSKSIGSGAMLVGATAFHGSPHLFSKFSLENLGSGEGAQAFGRGLYFAESPKVAMSYKKSTSYTDAVRQFRSELPDDADFDELLSLANSGNMSPQNTRVIKALADSDWLGYDYPAQAITGAFKYGKSHDMPKELKSAIEEYGNLYKVDIPDASISKMLDWDKSIKEQPIAVQQAFTTAKIKRGLPADADVQDLHHIIKRDSDFTDLLQEAGIPGIRYLDSSSRIQGKGTSNFVVFDPVDVKILEINEKPAVK